MTDVIINSFVAGAAQTLIGHPFDTIKTYKQINPTMNINIIIKNLIKNNGIFYLYRGFIPPLIGGCMQNSFMFSTENYIQNICNNNHYWSGFLAGGITTLVVSPSELFKTKLQVDKKISVKQIFKNTKFYRGLELTILRDAIGFSIYFGTYNYLQSKYNNPLVNGGITGVLSWIYSYPIDVIKTKHQISSHRLKNTLNSIKFNHLTSGMSIMLTRAFFVNAGIFYIFETLNKKEEYNN
jgi:solute carrier family 25 carnitine/acylcarnitine transporter 20/29